MPQKKLPFFAEAFFYILWMSIISHLLSHIYCLNVYFAIFTALVSLITVIFTWPG